MSAVTRQPRAAVVRLAAVVIIVPALAAALDGQPVDSLAALQSVLAAHQPGTHVQARVSRDGTESTVTVTLGSLTS